MKVYIFQSGKEPDVVGFTVDATGANLPARIALSMVNQEKPGFFFATFEGGKRGRFNLLLYFQNRIPVANFDINAGEKGLIFNYRADDMYNEVWMAFYGQDDYQRGTVQYSDVNDLIERHNRWYPVEARLAMDPRSRDFVKVGGRDYRREPLDADWVLRHFPPRR